MNDDTQHAAWTQATVQLLNPYKHLVRIIEKGTIGTDPSSLSSITPEQAAALKEIFARVDEGVGKMRNKLRAQLDESEERCASLTQDRDTWWEKHESLQSELLATQKTVIAGLSAGLSAGSASRRLTTNPTKFTGEQKDPAVRQTEFEVWRSKVMGNLATDENIFNTEFKRLHYAMDMLDGAAYQLFRVRWNSLLENKDGGPSMWPWQNTSAFFAELASVYATMDLKRSAKIEFERLWMGKASYPAFWMKLSSLGRESGKSKAQMVEELRRRVSDDLASAIKHQVTVPGDEDIEGWNGMFQALWHRKLETEQDAILRSGRVPGRSENTKSAPAAPQATLQTPPQAPDPDAMILDVARTGQPRPHVTPEERQRRREQGLCFYCSSPAHIAAHCDAPEKPRRRGQGAPGAQSGYGGAPRDAPRGRGGYGWRGAPRGGYGVYNLRAGGLGSRDGIGGYDTTLVTTPPPPTPRFNDWDHRSATQTRAIAYDPGYQTSDYGSENQGNA